MGYTTTFQALRERIAQFEGRRSDPILVACRDDRIVGLIAVHLTPMLHLAAPIARITTLVVDPQAHGSGIGRALVDAAEKLAREAGCALLEVTTALHRTDAQAFYRAIGFDPSAVKLQRSLA
ncbi:GNAT family N-acetyltransferase [Thalassobaculum sp.]|uniref:GNAT family N-acetyltransferase n=1 Tax=Thalassobaculum sp. TaxID=2022740 RepID=UPI0032EC1A56